VQAIALLPGGGLASTGLSQTARTNQSTLASPLA